MAASRAPPRTPASPTSRLAVLLTLLCAAFAIVLWTPRVSAPSAFVPGPQHRRHQAAHRQRHGSTEARLVPEDNALGPQAWLLAGSAVILGTTHPAMARDPPRTEPLGDEWKALIAPDIAVIIGAVAFNMYKKGIDEKK
mmetsp:Transcript_33909/g.77104  ORF Transcript_33909/g.77104 Transcript_33909/m.77104 type:complete len:139 (-) Transcript_33909:41-457(-)